jgi:Tfp pilus assembly protein PilV
VLKPSLWHAETHIAPVLFVTMLTFFSKPWLSGRSSTGPSQVGRRRLSAACADGEPLRPHLQPSGEHGFLLIEVIISALLVGVIVVGTLTGFGVIDRSTTATREHSEATLLAAESQEALRTDPASAFVKLSQSALQYTRTVGGTTYTITQSANFIGGEKGSGTCSATETTRKSTNSVRIASTVFWTEPNSKPGPVIESGIVTPPTGSALEVDVANGAPGTIGTAGVTAIVKYTPIETHSTATVVGTTGTAGCIVFGGIPATSASVEIPEQSGYVTPTGKLNWLTKEVEIAPNLTTHYLVPFARGGRIEAHFTYENQTTYLGKPVEGDTFVVANNLMQEPPDFEVGSSSIHYELGGEQIATVIPSQYVAALATTPTGSKYSTGDLFPFPESEWEVYAGDCPENNAGVLTKHVVANGKGPVAAGERTVVNIPMSLLTLNVYNGTGPKNEKGLASTQYPVTITNLKCATATPNNETEVNIKHNQTTSTSGHLEHFFQPFGAFELCLQNGARLDKVQYSVLTTNSAAPSIYLGQLSASERTKSREGAEKLEGEARNKRIAEESPAWEKLKNEETALSTRKGQEETKWKTRETEEGNLKTAQTNEENTKKADEVIEASERSTWQTAEAKGKPKLKKTERVAKEATQTAARKTREGKETSNAATRKSEETALHERKKNEEATKTTREKEETAAAKTRNEMEATRTARVAKETETETSRKTQEAAEVAEASPEVVVETGASC